MILAARAARLRSRIAGLVGVASLASLACFGATLLATGCSGAGDVAFLTADQPEARAFLAAHNEVRAATAPRAPLPPLVWSDALARDAARVAARCTLDHSRTENGENIAAAAPALSPTGAVALWEQEEADWDAASNRCRAGRICGHYTQLVWRSSREVGCASARCEGGDLGSHGPWVLAVCQYAPGGNLRGAPPY